MVIWSGLKIVLMMIVVPLLLGEIIIKIFKSYEKDKLSNMVFSYMVGQIAMWAIFQLISVPFILVKSRLWVVTVSWISIIILVTVAGICYIRKHKCKETINQYNSEKTENDGSKIVLTLALILAIIMVGYQCYMYVFYMHIDNDDSRFIVCAVDAYEKGTMYLTNPANGLYVGTWVGEMVKDVSSPWSIYLAMLGKILGIHPAILAHTVYPPILLAMAYLVYYILGNLLFHNKTKALMMVAVVTALNASFGQSVYNQSYFTIVRIWQGKAVVAGVLIPFLTYLLIRLYREDTKAGDYIFIIMTGMAMCLMSGMGIFFSGILIGILGGWFMIVKKQWKKIPYIVLCCIPTIIYGATYVLVK